MWQLCTPWAGNCRCGGIYLDCGELAELAKRAATRGDRARTDIALRAVLVWGSGQDGVDGRPANDRRLNCPTASWGRGAASSL
eukprot:SAG11_NODE_3013_length_2764_cov_4.581614_1_plen_83_part_00